MPTPVFVSCIGAFFVIAVILAVGLCMKYGLTSLAEIGLGYVIGMTSLILFAFAWAARTGNLPSA